MGLRRLSGFPPYLADKDSLTDMRVRQRSHFIGKNKWRKELFAVII
jgi:hypothetical protein